MVGTALVAGLAAAGHEVWKLVRANAAGEREVKWDPEAGEIDGRACEGFDAVFHLGGVNIAGRRWTRRFKQRIHDSRVKSTRLLAMTLSNLQRPPKAFFCASGVGNYGDAGDEWLDEQSPEADTFLARVGRDWEAACEPASLSGIRVVNMRFGVILSARGGALAKMLPPFRWGVGGRVGNGRQWWSWIGLEDVVGAATHLLSCPDVAGPVNFVSPEPVTNRVFTRTLGKVLRRFTIFPLPAVIARILVGEMANALLLTSARVRPAKLAAAGYEFQQPELERCLRAELNRPE